MGMRAVTSLLLFGLAGAFRVPSIDCPRPADHADTTVYNFTLPDLQEQRNISLSEYRGNILLLVNVATYCGFTWHYHQLNALKTRHNSARFDIVGLPCNQFAKQEPGGNGEEIFNGIKYVRPGRGFIPNFPLTKKIDVNGENEHPLYTFLKESCPPTRDQFREQEKLFYTPFKNSDIRWNFEKILVGRDGVPVKRYDPSTKPEDINTDIDYLIETQEHLIHQNSPDTQIVLSQKKK